jgi:hypothetical protein
MLSINFIVQHLNELPSSSTPLAKLLEEDIALANSKTAELHEKLAAFNP